jgi:hypothetical protein
MDAGEESAGSSIVAGCEAPEVLEAIEASLDGVAKPVDDPVVADGLAAVGFEGMTALAFFTLIRARGALLS